MTHKNVLLKGLLVGGISAAGIVALFYLGGLLVGLPFVPFDIFDWMARNFPGSIISFFIDNMVRVIHALNIGPTASTAKLTEQLIAILQFLVVGCIFGLAVAGLGLRYPNRIPRIGWVGGAILLAAMLLIETLFGFPQIGPIVSGLWMAILLLGWGWLLGRWTQIELAPDLPEQNSSVQNNSRRKFLAWIGASSLSLFLVALGVSRLKQTGQAAVAADPSPASGTPLIPNTDSAGVGPTSGPAASPSQNVLAARFAPAQGTRSELTPTRQFYRIDINANTPSTDPQAWRLKLDGMVSTPLSLTLDQVRAYPSQSQVITLSCISNEVGGDLISTGLWTGVPLKTLLTAAGLKPGAAFFNIKSFDNFYESLALAEAMDERTLLVYDMNGAPLSPEHGFPLRIYIPNHFGMKQPKWVEHIQVSDKSGSGFWVDRGWSPTAFVQTTSVIDSVAIGNKDPSTQTVPVGGIAYSGSRGISRVEVQVDNGPWQTAQLRVPSLSPLTWVQWRYDYLYQPGRHFFHVRAYDGDGKLQITDINPTLPSGATGMHTLSADL